MRASSPIGLVVVRAMRVMTSTGVGRADLKGGVFAGGRSARSDGLVMADDAASVGVLELFVVVMSGLSRSVRASALRTSRG
jgi:hypothetical protein